MNEPSTYSFEEDSSRIERMRQDASYERWSSRVDSIFKAHGEPKSVQKQQQRSAGNNGSGIVKEEFYTRDVTGVHLRQLHTNSSNHRHHSGASSSRTKNDNDYSDDFEDEVEQEEERYPSCFLGQVLLGTSIHHSVSYPTTPRLSRGHGGTATEGGGYEGRNPNEGNPNEDEGRTGHNNDAAAIHNNHYGGVERQIDDDARIASRLHTSTRQQKYGNQSERFTAWEGGVVAADAELLNKELHEMLAYVRSRNAVAEDAKRQLQRSKMVSAMIQKPLSMEEDDDDEE